jgi:stress-induced morphogen
MSASIALRYGIFGPRISSSSFNGKKGLSSHQVIEQP